MTAPFPAVEADDEPILFVATTLAHTLDPVVRLNGGDMIVVSCIVQFLPSIILAKVPSQLGNTSLKVSKLLYLIVML